MKAMAKPQVGDGGDNLEKRFFILSLTGRMRLSNFVFSKETLFLSDSVSDPESSLIPSGDYCVGLISR